MNKRSLFFMLVCISLTWFLSAPISASEPTDESHREEFETGDIRSADSPQSLQSNAKEKTVGFPVRLGQGGFSDSRSPLGKLGGGQIALDVKLRQFPPRPFVYRRILYQ